MGDFLVDIFNARMKELKEKFNSESKIIAFDYDSKVSKGELEKYMPKMVEEQEYLTQSEALNDFNQIKFYLRNFYSGYKVFGCKNFDNAFYNINLSLQSKEKIKTLEFIDLILSNLDFVIDNHFSFTYCNQKYKLKLPKYKTYYNNDYEIIFQFNNYYITLNGVKYLVRKVNGSENVEQFIKRGIKENGEIVLTFILHTHHFVVNLKVELAFIGTIILPLHKIELEVAKNDLLSIVKRDNFTLINNQRCYEKDDFEIKEFNKCIKALKKDENNIFVINTINGQGGDDDYVFKILSAIGENDLQNVESELALVINSVIDIEDVDSRINKFIKEYEISNKYGINNVAYLKCGNFQSMQGENLRHCENVIDCNNLCLDYFKTNDKVDNALHNNNAVHNKNVLQNNNALQNKNALQKEKVIIILNNNQTSSANESYINLINNKNAIFIGDYTKGCFQFCPSRKFSLAHCGAKLNIGCRFYYLGNVADFNNDLNLSNDNKVNENKINDNKVNENKINCNIINQSTINQNKINENKSNDNKINDNKANENEINCNMINEQVCKIEFNQCNNLNIKYLPLENVGIEPDLFLLCDNDKYMQMIENFINHYLKSYLN